MKMQNKYIMSCKCGSQNEEICQMKYYVVFLSMLDVELSTEYRQDHLDYLEQLKREGKTFAFGRFTDGAGGMIIYIADSLEEAKEYAENDPYIIQKARTYQIHEWDMKR
jgi:uncharacterized protein YciI